jgi:KaiC/GvpD/RAD55 family RecA-like ATPase
MRVEVVNTSKEQGFLQKLEGVIPSGLNCIHLPSFCSLVNDSIVSNNEKIGPFEVVTIKLKLKASKTGIYHLTPKLSYADELGKTKTCDSEPIDLTVEVAKQPFEILAGRVTAGTFELDRLLMGGIPEKYAVMLAAPSCDERELLIERFLEAGATIGETTFYITAETGNKKALAEKYLSNFYLIVCNPQADAMIQNLPNVYKLKGVENLTDIDIALAMAFRMLKPKETGPKRICIEIISDALLQHHAVNTRRWLSALLPTLKSKGFTILAVVDSQMHPVEELQAVLGLFDGEISIYEKETGKGSARFLKVKRLSNQKYSRDEAILT